MKDGFILCGPNDTQSPLTPARCAELQGDLFAGAFFAERHCSKRCPYYCAPIVGGDAARIAHIAGEAAKIAARREAEKHRKDKML